MVAPNFNWKGSTENPEGVAKFSVGSLSVEVPFGTFKEAEKVYNLILAAHIEGVLGGQKSMRRYVENALTDSQGNWA